MQRQRLKFSMLGSFTSALETVLSPSNASIPSPLLPAVMCEPIKKAVANFQRWAVVGNKHYYKGTRSTGVGLQNSHGSYIVNWNKVRTYVVPANLETSELKSLVSPRVPQIHQKFIGYPDGAKNAQLAFKNVVDFIEHGENYNDVNLEESQYLEEFVNEDFTQNQNTQSPAETLPKE